MTKSERNQNVYGLIVLAIAAILGLLSAACGKAGAPGAAGKDGQSIVGPVGPQGAVGPQGSVGADGSSVTVVKLCPGVTTYPSKFVEIGFCIGGKLYGTYSANDGFSTELPPGAYGSNGINASCNFTILPNCVISN